MSLLLAGLVLSTVILSDLSHAFLLKKAKKAAVDFVLYEALQSKKSEKKPMMVMMPMPVLGSPMVPQLAPIEKSTVVVYDRPHHIDEFDMGRHIGFHELGQL